MRDLVDVDVLMMTDCRFPGGNSASVYEEVVAQSRAGYRTAILHVPSPVLRRPRPFSPKIRQLLDDGVAELVVGRRRVRTRLVLARHPTIFSDPPADLPSIESEAAVLAVNQVPEDDRGVRPYYDVAQVATNLERVLGGPAVWAPIGPRVRDSLVDVADLVGLADSDWENVIDVAAWRVDRTGFVGDRPVIGRHSRGHWSKWPDRVDDILAAYPDDPRYVVSVLGGVDAPVKLLAGLPGNWIDHPFDSIPARRFLAGIDFFVYYHHPGLVEAFGRVVLEAMSAGAVCIVPPYLERLFGDVCLYGAPSDVRGHVDRQFGDWTAYADRSRRGVELAHRRFSYETHIGRVAALIGPPEESSPVHPTGGLPRHETAVPTPPDDVVVVVDLTSLDVGDPHPVVRAAATIPGTVLITVAGDVDVVVDRTELLPRALRSMRPERRDEILRARIGELTRAHATRSVVLASDSIDRARSIATRVDGAATMVWAVVPSSSSDGSTAQHGCPPSPLATLVEQIPTAERRDPLVLVEITPRSTYPLAAGAGPNPSPPSRSPLRRLRAAMVARGDRAKLHLAPFVERIRPFRSRARRIAQRVVSRASGTGERAPVWPVSGVCTHPRPDELPAVLVVLTGSDPATAAELIRAVAVRQTVTSSFRPYLLVPPSVEPIAHGHRLVAESILPEDAWARLHPQRPWSTYLRERTRAARLTFGADSVLATDGSDPRLVVETLDAGTG